MSFKKKRNRRGATIAAGFIGFIMVFSMLITLLAPDLGRRSSSSNTTYNTPVPEPTEFTIPTPEVDPPLSGRSVYIHPSGYFQTFFPEGSDWQAYQDPDATASDPTYTGIVIQSVPRLSVIHTYLQQGVAFNSLESLSENYFNAEEFDKNWGQYDAWTETSRLLAGDRVIIDFALELGGYDYLGRTTGWLDNDFLYIYRLVVPDNNRALLDLLDDDVAANFKGYHDVQNLPQTWPVYEDRTLGLLIKHAPGWSIVAGGEGRPTTFRVPEGQVRVLTETESAIESEEQAEQWVIDHEQNATIIATEAIDREMGTGYALAYAYQDAAGDSHSGLAVLLTGANDTLYVANAQVETPDLNLLAVDDSTTAAHYDLRRSLVEGLIVLPDEAR